MSTTKLNIELLRKVCEIPGAPGYETLIRDFIHGRLKNLADEISVDKMGNLIAVRRGRKRHKVMSAAHMDEIGFIVTHIDDQGYLRFHTLGGFDPKTLTAQRVIVHGKKDLIGVMGSKPVHLMSADEKNKAPQLKDYFIDLGMPAKEVHKWIRVGNPVTRERSLIEMGNCVNCKSLDNRVSVYILLDSLSQLVRSELPYDYYAAFTVQEEVGTRGAIVAAHHVEPDLAIALDTTIAFDTPGAASHERVTSLGKGAAIKIMDSSTICDPRMVSFLQDTADRHKISWQSEILPAGGTDTSALQRNGKSGAIAGAISVPTRHIHQVIETVDKNDILSCTRLLSTALKEIDKKDWSPWKNK